MSLPDLTELKSQLIFITANEVHPHLCSTFVHLNKTAKIKV